MTGLVEVRGGVFSNRLIAAAHVAADQASSQMDPTLLDLEALLAAFCARIRLR
jgi:hypothetical protein